MLTIRAWLRRLADSTGRRRSPVPRTARRIPLHLCAVLACVATTLTACGVATFIVQQYDGEPLSNSRIAILRVNGDSPVLLEELDGEVLSYELRDSGSRIHIEMLPGMHEIGLADGSGLPLKRRRFVAEAGKVYRPMVFHTTPSAPDPSPLGSWAVAIYEVDRDSDAIIREISQVALPAPSTSHGPLNGPAPLNGRAPHGNPKPTIPNAPPSTEQPAPSVDQPAPPSVDALPNTTNPAAESPAAPLAPLPPGVNPAKGPAPNAPPPGAEPL